MPAGVYNPCGQNGKKSLKVKKVPSTEREINVYVVKKERKAMKKAEPIQTQSFLHDKKQGYVYFQDQNITIR